jgi:hypothetical protein
LSIIVAIIIVLVLVGSVLLLKPSAAQQRQTNLRLLARELGLDVRLCTLPQTRRVRVRKEPAEQGVVYRLLQFGEKNRQVIECQVCRADAQSEWENETGAELPPAVQNQLNSVLMQLPADAVAFEITPQECGVYWKERGDENTVRSIRRLLGEMQQALIAKT